jgi:fibronectin-binding autotransporter adhesin
VNNGTLDLGANHTETVGAVALNGGSITGTGTSALTAASYGFGSGTVSVILAGSGVLTKTGGGTVTLSGANTFTGGTMLNSGVLSIASDANLGGASSALAFNGGRLQITGNAMSNFGARVVNYSTFNGGLDIASARFPPDSAARAV